MKILKRLFVGSIILLMLTTSLLVTAGVNENTNSSPITSSDENSLGTVVLVHSPLKLLPGDRGLNVMDYFPPDGNPHYIYKFPEDENGYVYMNFTLHVRHRLNPIGTYWLEYIFGDEHRWTGIELWISDDQDYCNITYTKACNNSVFEDYNISIIANTGLFTNGENRTCLFWLNAWPGLTNIPIIRDEICKNRLLTDHVYDGHITIVPT